MKLEHPLSRKRPCGNADCNDRYGQAYISISLDATGLLRFLAFWVASKGGSSGRRLFAYLYLFFLVSGVVVGNVSSLEDRRAL